MNLTLPNAPFRRCMGAGHRRVLAATALGILLAGPPALGAECDADLVLDRLQREVTGALDGERLERARTLLLEYCGEAVIEASETARAEATAEVEKKAFEVFGIELRKAEPGSAGHDRLKK